MEKIGSWQKNFVVSIRNKWEKQHKFFIFALLFGATKRRNVSEAPQRSAKIRIYVIFYLNQLFSAVLNRKI